jgi:biopolymer transport protein ExbB
MLFLGGDSMPLWLILTLWLARFILLLLIGLSVWSLAIILDRRRYFRSINADQLFEKASQKGSSYRPDHVLQSLSEFIVIERQKMEKGLSVLGTLGATTPFIGLLGTILGIIVAFGELAQASSDMNAIMFALAEALILTAMGLAVAIPAVISFNFYSKKIRALLERVQSKLQSSLAQLQ